jgi:hypothetical protein
LPLILGYQGVKYLMRLNLPFPPIPENAPKLAELAVQAARNVDGINLIEPQT